jgi:hypothetical protein
MGHTICLLIYQGITGIFQHVKRSARRFCPCLFLRKSLLVPIVPTLQLSVSKIQVAAFKKLNHQLNDSVLTVSSSK